MIPVAGSSIADINTCGSVRDVNLDLAGALLDMAALAGNSQRAWGYKRAAKAVLRLDQHITPLVEANTFRAVPGIGPTTDRIAREIIADGQSAFVERAVREAAKEREIETLHGLRSNFLSRAAVQEILERRGGPSRAKYRGDFQMHSIWSDGAEPLDSIAEACLARGYAYCAITDHSYGLPIAGGMSMEAEPEQHAEIDHRDDVAAQAEHARERRRCQHDARDRLDRQGLAHVIDRQRELLAPQLEADEP